MKLSISIATSSRRYEKAMRRVLGRFHSLESRIASLNCKSPAPAAILLGISDDLDEQHLEVVQNDDEFYQVLRFCKFDPDEYELFRSVLFIVWATVEDCPMQKVDWDIINKLFEEFELENME